MQRHFARLGLNTRPDGSPPEAFGRFEAAAPGDLWTGDALHGPTIAGRKTYLFCFIDDHSRALVGYRWGLSEDTVRLEAAFRSALASRGVPRAVYLDNGSAMVSTPAAAGVCQPRDASGALPTGKATRPREDRTGLRDGAHPVPRRGRSPACPPTWPNSTGSSAPGSRPSITAVSIQRPARHRSSGCWPAAPPVLPTPAALHEAFLWSETRTVTKTATISLHGNSFEVDAALVGSRVEVVFDPFDLESVEIRFQGRSMGQGLPVSIGRHSHPQARTEAAPAPAPTGIDYLGLLAERREAELARSINYAQLRLDGTEAQEHTLDITNQRQQQRQGEPAMTIDRLRAHWGFTRMPFAKDLAPSMLHTHRSHAEAVGPDHLVHRRAGDGGGHR